MSDMVQILIWPFIASLVLVSIHSYLGLHVVARGVIFVDLSLAQVAALGTAMGSLFGFDIHDPACYMLSLGFTLAGAIFFALSRSRKKQIPQEAVIGIVYAVSAAAAILLMDRLPEGGEHIKHILVGSLLSVSPREVFKMTVLFSVVGLLHWLWRKPLFAISMDPEGARKSGYSLLLWDFFFYATFGVVVTSAVAIAGVLLVFTLLIVPPVSSALFSDHIGKRLLIGWIMGGGVSALGIFGSYFLDAPTGATVICAFGGALGILAVFRRLLPSRR